MKQQILEAEIVILKAKIDTLIDEMADMVRTITIRDATIAAQANTMTMMVKAQDNNAEFKPFLFHRNAAMDRDRANNYSGQ